MSPRDSACTLAAVQTFLHCGYYKCGSTALQDALSIHAASLATEGILYPTTGRDHLPSHSALAFALLAEDGQKPPPWFNDLNGGGALPTFDGFVRDIHAEVEKANFNRVVISSEEFIRVGQSKDPIPLVQRMRDAFADYDPVVVFYLRRPDHYLLSWYGQMLRLGNTPPRFVKALPRYLRTIHGDYVKALEPWFEVFGRDRVIVHRYEKVQTGDVLVDFADIVKITSDFSLPKRVNESIPSQLYEVFRLGNQTSSDYDYRQLRIKAVGDLIESQIWRSINRINVDHFGDEGREMLYEHFAPLNEALAVMVGTSGGYFDDLDEILQPPPRPRIGVPESLARFRLTFLEAVLSASVGKDAPSQ